MSSSFLIKLQPCSLQYQKSLRHRCFPVSFAKFLRTYNLWNPCKWLLPKMPKAENTTQPVFTCSKLTIKTLEQGVKYVPKLIIKTPERRQLRLSRVFIVNFEHIPHLVLMFPFWLWTCYFRLESFLLFFSYCFLKWYLVGRDVRVLANVKTYCYYNIDSHLVWVNSFASKYYHYVQKLAQRILKHSKAS